MTEILRCPFCGGKPRKSEGLNEHWISCMSCQASSIMRSNIDAAISAWNARAPAQCAPDYGKMSVDMAIEACAQLINENQETCSETADGTRRHLTPRKAGNLAGLAYADGIRALSAVTSTERCRD